jgi:hypothetical protein
MEQNESTMQETEFVIWKSTFMCEKRDAPCKMQNGRNSFIDLKHNCQGHVQIQHFEKFIYFIFVHSVV